MVPPRNASTVVLLRPGAQGDFEILLIATVLEVEVSELLVMPKVEPKQPLYIALSNLLAGQVKTLASPDEILTERSLRCLPIETAEQ